MSTASVSYFQLPFTGDVKTGDFFVIEDVSQTKKLDYKNLQIGLDNVTFASTVSSQTTDVTGLSSSITSLSAQILQQAQYILNLGNINANNSIQRFINLVFPVGSFMFTESNNTPNNFVVGTNWLNVSQGLFIAGVGSGVDKNGNGFTVSPQLANSNFVAGEYNHTLNVSELPSHNHTFAPFEGTTTSIAGIYVESGPGPGSPSAPFTSTSTGNNVPHNNIPPVYGLYVWLRIS
jgi:hypothetical protein